MLMATLVSIGGQGAEAPLVSADYRKFAQYELATHGYLTAVREPQQVPKTGDCNTAGNVCLRGKRCRGGRG
jgi:hypothetical protein